MVGWGVVMVGWGVSDGGKVLSMELITPLVKTHADHKCHSPKSAADLKLATLKPHIHHNKLKGVYAQSLCWRGRSGQCVHRASVGEDGLDSVCTEPLLVRTVWTVCAQSLCWWGRSGQCVHRASVGGDGLDSVCTEPLLVGTVWTVCAQSLCW